MTKDDFCERSIKIHGSKYDYSLVNYIDNRTKVKIICEKHGIFEQVPFTHLNGSSCHKCVTNKKDKNSFITDAKRVHGDKYDYSLIDEIKSNKEKVKIICKEHGIFEQSYNNHISKSTGCPICVNRNIKSSTEEFIKKSKYIHGDRYDYSLVDYVSNKKKVKIICDKHGIFEQEPYSHIRLKCGCRKCNKSKGEIKISEILNEMGLEFIYAHRVDNFEFDFYLPSMNIIIEYDGEQHYRPIEHFGGEIKFNKQVENDKIKNEYCYKNNIRLIRIPYTDFNRLNIEYISYFTSSKSASTTPPSSEPGLVSFVGCDSVCL